MSLEKLSESLTSPHLTRRRDMPQFFKPFQMMDSFHKKTSRFTTFDKHNFESKSYLSFISISDAMLKS